MQVQIEREITENLTGEMRETALDFTAFLKERGLMFYRDRLGAWAELRFCIMKPVEKWECLWASADFQCVGC